MENRSDLVEMTADIASAYVSANPVAPQDLPTLIRTIYNALREVAGAVSLPADASQEPAVSRHF